MALVGFDGRLDLDALEDSDCCDSCDCSDGADTDADACAEDANDVCLRRLRLAVIMVLACRAETGLFLIVDPMYA